MHQFLFRIESIISLFLLIWTLANFAELHSLQECHKIACMRTWVNFFCYLKQCKELRSLEKCCVVLIKKNYCLPHPSLQFLMMMMIDWCIFILLSRESDGALCFGRSRTRLGVDHFPSFPVDVLTSSLVNLLLVRSHQAEIIIVKRLIQGRNNVTRVRVELMTLRSESS